MATDLPTEGCESQRVWSQAVHRQSQEHMETFDVILAREPSAAWLYAPYRVPYSRLSCSCSTALRAPSLMARAPLRASDFHDWRRGLGNPLSPLTLATRATWACRSRADVLAVSADTRRRPRSPHEARHQRRCMGPEWVTCVRVRRVSTGWACAGVVGCWSYSPMPTRTVSMPGIVTAHSVSPFRS